MGSGMAGSLWAAVRDAGQLSGWDWSRLLMPERPVRNKHCDPEIDMSPVCQSRQAEALDLPARRGHNCILATLKVCEVKERGDPHSHDAHFARDDWALH